MILSVLLVADVYFVVAFVAAARGDLHVWQARLRGERNYLESLRDHAYIKQLRDEAQKAYGQDHQLRDELDRRWREINSTESGRQNEAAHLGPLLRFHHLRGYVDFYLPPVYGFVAALYLVYELAQSLA